MYNLEQNIITGAIDDYTQEYNPISRTEFISVSEDWSVTDKYVISKTIESDDSVVVGFNVIEPLAYKKVIGVCVSFKSTGDVQSVGIGNTNLIRYCNKDTTDERQQPEDYEPLTVEEAEKDTISKHMFVKTDHSDDISDENIKGMVYNYSVGDDQYLFDWSSDELKDILFNQGVFVRITYTPINTNVVENENITETSDSDEITITDLTLQVYFSNELQDEIDIIENRLENINLQKVIDNQGNIEFRYHYVTKDGVPSTENISEWSSTPLEPTTENKIVYYIVLSYGKSTEEYSDISPPEIYAEYNDENNSIYYYEYIYKVNNNPVTPLCPTIYPSTGVAPTGWSVIYETTSDKFPYGWKCFRKRKKGENWGRYTGLSNIDNKNVAIAYSSTEIDVNDMKYQYCYILVPTDGKPPVLEYYMDELEYSSQHPWYVDRLEEKYGQLPSPSFSFRRPNVSKDYPYLYAFRREQTQYFQWSLWRGCSAIHQEYTVNNEKIHYLRYTGILIDYYNYSGKEDEVQYCYKGSPSNVPVNLIWSDNDNECYQDKDGVTPNQSGNFIPQGFTNTINYQSASSNYPYRLKRVKHLDRWGMWSGDKEVYYK